MRGDFERQEAWVASGSASDARHKHTHSCITPVTIVCLSCRSAADAWARLFRFEASSFQRRQTRSRVAAERLSLSSASGDTKRVTGASDARNIPFPSHFISLPFSPSERHASAIRSLLPLSLFLLSRTVHAICASTPTDKSFMRFQEERRSDTRATQ